MNPASVSNKSIISSLADEQHLLSAVFEINGKVCQVMVDTGATISCIPENGEILKNARNRVEKADMTLQMANQVTERVTSKIKAHMRPAGSTIKPASVQFYIYPNMRDIFVFEALIGLKQLKDFNLQIETRDKQVLIYHEGKLIGNESPALSSITATIKVIDKMPQLQQQQGLEQK